LAQARAEILERAGLGDLEKRLQEFARSFDGLTLVQQLEMTERIVESVVVKSGNRLEGRCLTTREETIQ
jgi:hypothetical protein